MKVKGVRMHGPLKVSMDEFELPEIKDDEILATVVTNTYACQHTRRQSWLKVIDVCLIIFQQTQLSQDTSLQVKS